MLEYQAAMEEFLYSLHCDLWNISHLDPSEFVTKAQGLVSSGLESQVIGMLKQGIVEYRSDRAIMKYMYIIDKLLKIGSFAAVLQNSLVELYSDIFMSLLIQKCNNEIEEIKILRKFWVGSLHPILIARIREVVLAKTSIDIDTGFKNDTLLFIRNYYISKLQMNSEEAKYHLPQLQQKTGDQNRQPLNRAYIIEPAIKTNPPPPVQQFQQMQQAQQAYQAQQMQQQMHILQIQNMKKAEMQKTQQLPQNIINPNVAPVQQQMIPQNAFRLIDKIQMEQIKRQRFSSQQTKLPTPPFESQPPNAYPRKQVHKNQQAEQGYALILRRLSQMNRFTCKECGMTFLTKEKQEKHTNEHLKEKLNRIDKGFGRKTLKVKLVGRAEWVQKQGGQKFSEHTFCISMSSLNQSISEYKCDFCSAALEPEFRHNQWVLSNAAKIDIDGKEGLMHKTCQLALENDSSSEDQNNNKELQN